MTDVSKPGKGMLDAAISPDGKQIAAVVPTQERDEPAGRPSATTSLLPNAKELNVQACKAIWRPDGRELLVVHADDCLGVRDRRARAVAA